MGVQFSFWYGVQPEGPKMGLVEQIGAKFRGLLNGFFDNNAACKTEFWPK